MNVIICGRITREYRTLSSVFDSWAKQSDKYYVYEHEADEKVNRTHCHFLFVGSKTTVKNLKDRGIYKELKLARSDHAYKEWDEEKGKTYIRYMTKGKLQPMLTNDNEKCECERKLWVDNVNKKNTVEAKRKKKEDYFDICMRIREKCTYEATIDTKDEFGYPCVRVIRSIKSFDEMYNMLLKEMDENRIRSSENDIDRWITTIVRNDERMGSQVRERMRKKFSPA